MGSDIFVLLNQNWAMTISSKASSRKQPLNDEAPLFVGNIVTITKARKLLGKPLSDAFSDNQVIDLLLTLKLLARKQLGYNGSKNEYKP